MTLKDKFSKVDWEQLFVYLTFSFSSFWNFQKNLFHF